MNQRAAHTRTTLLVVLLAAQVAATGRGFAHRPPARAPPRLEIDLERDPPWRLRLVPGIGPARARRIIAARVPPGDDPQALLDRALGPRLAARIAAAPLVEFVGDG